jgi:hypothetical protein
MDGVALFVKIHSHEHVEDAMRPYGLQNESVSDGSRMFFFRRYPGWEVECEPGEESQLIARLGGPVAAAFMIESRHGANARFALEALAGVLRVIGFAVVEDHFGGLWDSEQIDDFASAIDNDIFSLAMQGRRAAQ